jgi:hypothetical protein
MRAILSVLLIGAARSQPAVFVCPGPPGNANAYEGIVVGLADAQTYVAVLEVSPDGGTFWDKTCGYPYHYECGPDTDTPGTILLGNAVGARGHGFPIAADGRFTISNWATALPEDTNAHFLQVFVLLKTALEANPYFLYAHGEGAQIEPEVIAVTLHSAVIDKVRPPHGDAVRGSLTHPLPLPSHHTHTHTLLLHTTHGTRNTAKLSSPSQTVPLNAICASLSPSPSPPPTPSSSTSSAASQTTAQPVAAIEIDPFVVTKTVTVTVTEAAPPAPATPSQAVVTAGDVTLSSGVTATSVIYAAVAAVAAAFLVLGPA